MAKRTASSRARRRALLQIRSAQERRERFQKQLDRWALDKRPFVSLQALKLWHDFNSAKPAQRVEAKHEGEIKINFVCP